MRGESPATSARSLPLNTRQSWSSWIATEVRQRRRTIKEEQLETVERLASQERRTRRSGPYESNLGTQRPWC